MPEPRLAEMTELYKRVKNTAYLPEPHRLSTSLSMDKDVRKLNQLRNEFIHFTPKGFSLELSGMPRIVGHCCDAIEHLSIKHPTYWGHLNDELRQRIEIALASLRGHVWTWASRHGLEIDHPRTPSPTQQPTAEAREP